ncbi:MAG: hypothetical protein LBJ76_00190, partial [Candidatus Accumulibacter sp.]|nr:hypothetical protein [Accumulibacter sp.]
MHSGFRVLVKFFPAGLLFSAFSFFSLFFPLPSAAQVVAYRQGAVTMQPEILGAGNGVPLINIRSPSAAGVSRNHYSQFDVQSNGVIL